MSMNEGTVDWTTAVVVGGCVGWAAERFMHTDVHPIVNVATAIVGALLMNVFLRWIDVSMGGWFGYIVKGFVGSCLLLAPLLIYRKWTEPPRDDEWK